ncbi:MAG: MATE family efflux transporter [Lawsonibacter sp.]|nr:MATE family efflux transporter [Lawsonibacter sp.]
MYEGKPCALFFRFAVPQMIGLLFNSAYTIVDGVFIGNRLGREAMAAAAVAVPLIEILISVAIAVGAGAGVLIAARLGSGEQDKAREVFSTAVWMLGGVGLLIAGLGNLFLAPLARLLGATPDILNQSMDYLWFIATFAPFQLFSFLLGGMVRNDGRPKLAMTAMILGAVSNIILDYVFIYPLNWGIWGAAFATALGPIFSVLILLPHFLSRRGSLFFTGRRPVLQAAGGILTFGFPSFIMEFSIGMITFLYNLSITQCGYGELGLAAYLVIGYMMLIVLTLFLGMAEGLQPVFSHFMASGEVERGRAVRRFSVRVFIGTGLVCYALVVLLGREFYTVFSPGDPELVDFVCAKSPLYFFGYFLAGYNILMVSFWQSNGMMRRALVLSLLRSLIFPPILLTVLPLVFDRELIWGCQSFGEVLAACCAVGMLHSERNGRDRQAVPPGRRL